MPTPLEFFLDCVRFETTSDAGCPDSPSTPGQLELARHLVDVLRGLGAADARVSEYGVVLATVPASPGLESLPAVGFLSHMDTSPQASGHDPRPRLLRRYPGGPITLDGAAGITIDPADYPELNDYVGEDLVVTDGRTLLGADDKAGIAAILTLCQTLLGTGAPPHGRVRVAFTPDEEIARGADHLDIAEFGVEFAYTVDGGVRGRLDLENFNAAIAEVRFSGREIHPGAAKGRMVSALKRACRLVAALPPDECPETTEGRQGYYHAQSLSGSVGQARVSVLLRDHDSDGLERRKETLRRLAREIAPDAEVAIRDQYRNMRARLRAAPRVVELARAAYRDCGLEPIELPQRGGTDGALLTERGLPCPNIFAGGHNYHSVREYLPVRSLELVPRVLLRIVERLAAGA